MSPKNKKRNPATTSPEPKEFASTWEIVRLIVLPEKGTLTIFINTSQFSQVFKIIASKCFLNLLLAVQIDFSKEKNYARFREKVDVPLN